MKRLVLAPLLVLLCAPLLDGRVAVPECYATPQATVASYWHRMIERRHADALDCFVVWRHEDVTGMLALPDLVELRCRDFQVEFRGGGIVDVGYAVEYRITLEDSLASFPTGDRLVLTGTGWKIAQPLLVAQRAR